MSPAHELREALDVINSTAQFTDPLDKRNVVIHIHIHIESPEAPIHQKSS